MINSQSQLGSTTIKILTLTSLELVIWLSFVIMRRLAYMNSTWLIISVRKHKMRKFWLVLELPVLVQSIPQLCFKETILNGRVVGYWLELGLTWTKVVITAGKVLRWVRVIVTEILVLCNNKNDRLPLAVNPVEISAKSLSLALIQKKSKKKKTNIQFKQK